MPGPDDIEMRVDFITIGTVGEPGNRTFHLQARQDDRLVTFTIEKEQAQALSEGIMQLIEQIAEEYDRATPEVSYQETEMALLEPIQPVFRVSQMRLGYDNRLDLLLLTVVEAQLEEDAPDAREANMSMTRRQTRRLAQHAHEVVNRGRAKPEQNGYRMHY